MMAFLSQITKQKSKIKNLLLIFIISILLLLMGQDTFCSKKQSHLVRVGMYTRVRSLTVGPGTYQARDVKTGKTRPVTWGKEMPVRATAKGLVIGRKNFGWRLSIEPKKSGGLVRLKGRPYRGRMELMCNVKGQITAVNVLDVEDYVKGILVHEANPGWPEQALKGQAVICRTYALRNKGRHGKDGYDVCNTIHCQVYRGKLSETKITNQIVKSTKGDVVFYKKKLITAVYHSCCGGRTENAENVWQGGGVPYLKSRRCKWCRGSKHFYWTYDVNKKNMSDKLRAKGYHLGKIKSMRVSSRSRSGRAYEVRVIGKKSKATIQANQLRLMINGRGIKSTLWSSVSKKRKVFRFHGNGWGHGVGVCQWGMKGLADKGKGYREILRFYYKGSKVKNIY